MDDHDQDLGELDSEESFQIPAAERRVVTQPLDLSIQTLKDQWEDELLILPDIQREYLWDNAKASKLIESLILNIPIPVIYFSETDDAKYEIIDGHQRVKSIVRFLHDDFKLANLSVLQEFNGLSFKQLPDREKRLLRMRTLRTILISNESHHSIKFEIFERLNTGSILLNAQELRNSIYRGYFNDLLHALVKDTKFRDLVGSKSPRKRMVDEEIVLRFFAIEARINAYKPPLKRFLNEYMRDARKFATTDIDAKRDLFQHAITQVRKVIGPSAFRVTDRDGNPIEHSVNRALLEAQMVACSWICSDPSPQQLAAARSRIWSLFSDAEFLDSIRRATGDRSRTLKRLRDTVDALSSAGIALQAHADLSK